MVRLLRRECYQENSTLFFFFAAEASTGTFRSDSILQNIGARSRLLYVTGCKKPLTLDPPRMNSVLPKAAELKLLCLFCRAFNPNCEGAVDGLFHLCIHHDSNWSSCSTVIVAVSVSSIWTFIALLIARHHSQFLFPYTSTTPPTLHRLLPSIPNTQRRERRQEGFNRVPNTCPLLGASHFGVCINTKLVTIAHLLRFERRIECTR